MLSFFPIQLHNLESILGDLRGSSSDFYPDLAGGGVANRAGNKPQGCLDDGLQGECFKNEKLQVFFFTELVQKHHWIISERNAAMFSTAVLI